MKELLKQIPSKFLGMFNSLLDAISNQLSTTKGIFIFVIVLACLVDIYLKGSVGVIAFTIQQITILLEALKAFSWPVVVAVLLVLVYKDKK